jgi:DNA-binding IclR family transcriptional regulator
VRWPPPPKTPTRQVLAAGFGKPDEFGPNAKRTVDAFLAELEKTRARGYGVALEEAEPGVSAVATVIKPDDEDVVGVVAVSAPAFRLAKGRIAEVAQLANKAASDLAVVWPLRALVPSDTVIARAAS